MALLTILRSNLKSKKGNFISIFLFVFIIALSLTTIISVTEGSARRLKNACEASHIADIVSFIPEDKLSSDMIQGIKATDGISEVEILQSVVSSKVSIKGKSVDFSIYMTAYNPKQHSFQMLNTDLSGFIKDDSLQPKREEVFLPVSFHNTIHCNIGDQIQIETAEGVKNYKIARFIEEPFVGTGVMGIKEIFLNQGEMASLIDITDGKKLYANSIVNITVDKSKLSSLSAVKKSINVNTGLVSNSIYTITKEEANNYTLLFTKIIGGILSAFAVLLFVIILIVIGHTVSTGIEMDYITIGILKSQGFTSVQIRSILLMQYLAAGVVGTIIGIVSAFVTIPYVNRILLPVTGLLVGRDTRLLQSIGAMGFLLLLIAFYTYLKTGGILKVSPVRAISNGRAPIYFSNWADFSITKNLPLPLSIKMVLKEIAGNFKRYLSTILIMGILAFFTMSVTSLNQMTRSDNVDNSVGNISSDIDIYYSKDTDTALLDSIETEINQQDTIVSEFHLSNRYITVDDMEYQGHIIDRTDILKKPLKGRIPKYDNEIIITEIMSKDIGKGIGDTITLKYGNKQADYMIVGLNQYLSDAGKNFFILLSGMKRLDPKYKVSSTSYLIKDRNKTAEIVKYLQEEYKDQKYNLEIVDAYQQNKDGFHDILTAVAAITAITYVIAILFDAIVSFIICQKFFLREKRNMGIYKSVGFTSWELRGQFIIRFIIVVLIGGGVGLICNCIWNDGLMSLLLSGMGISHFTTRYSAANILVPILCISCFASLFAIIISGKISSVSPKNLIQE